MDYIVPLRAYTYTRVYYQGAEDKLTKVNQPPSR